MGAYINLFCVFHASPELAVAGNAHRKSAELNKERGVDGSEERLEVFGKGRKNGFVDAYGEASAAAP